MGGLKLQALLQVVSLLAQSGRCPLPASPNLGCLSGAVCQSPAKAEIINLPMGGCFPPPTHHSYHLLPRQLALRSAEAPSATVLPASQRTQDSRQPSLACRLPLEGAERKRGFLGEHSATGTPQCTAHAEKPKRTGASSNCSPAPRKLTH